MKKKERSREKKRQKKKKKEEEEEEKRKPVDLTKQKLWTPQSSKIYVGATELCILVFENTHFLFSISITLTQIFEF